MMGLIRKRNHIRGQKNGIFFSVDDSEESEENEEATVSPFMGGKEKKDGKRKLHDEFDKKEKSCKGSKEWDCVSVDDSEKNEEASMSPSAGGKDKKSGKRKLFGSAPATVPIVSKSTTIMVHVALLGSAIKVEVAFLTPPPSSDLRSQALPSGEDGRCPDIWRGWLFTYALHQVFGN
ncbi:hypothetical protein Pyn_08986 [Prunus yedoensis var. nudiflora]|uniref:Uncharacterized protein n=1 Tax=Prunus yedoensis var. nudiflora TaxID=2094558 RepID=A0A314UU32_PRUYE|nr:hypothetical protein Pyn_08986 [Prunus yedoensis var. nudiflora]